MLLQIITDVTEDTASTGRDTGCHQEHVLCQFQLLQATAQAVVSVSLPTDTLTVESTALTVKPRIVAGSRIQAGPRIQAGGSSELYQ